MMEMPPAPKPQERPRGDKFRDLKKNLEKRKPMAEDVAALQAFSDQLILAVDIDRLEVWELDAEIGRLRTGEGNDDAIVQKEKERRKAEADRDKALDKLETMMPSIRHLLPSDVTIDDMFSDPNTFVVAMRDFAGLKGFERMEPNAYAEKKEENDDDTDG